MLPTCVPRGVQRGGEGSVASCSLHCRACQTWVRAAWCKYGFTEETVLRDVEASIALFFPVKILELRAPSLYLLPSKPPKVLTLKRFLYFILCDWESACTRAPCVTGSHQARRGHRIPRTQGHWRLNRQSGPRQKQVLLTASLQPHSAMHT